MKNTIIYFAIGIFGLLLGSWWPQSELSIARSEINTLKKELASRSNRSILPDMARMLTMPETMPSRTILKPTPVKPEKKTPTPAPDSSLGLATEEIAEMKPEEEFADEMSRVFDDADTTEDALKTMADLWKTRRDIARDALASNLDLTDSDLEAFDSAMADMNDNLEDKFKAIADKFSDMEEGSEPSPEDAFRMAYDFTGIFVDTYDAMDDTLPDGWREDNPKPLDLTAFIDPYVLEPMMDLDDKWSE